MNRLAVAWLIGMVSFLILGSVAIAQGAPEFKLGFKALADQLGVDVVGTPVENEYFNLSNGNAEQHTTKGLMVWRKADNWTAFTNGYMTWVNGPNGVQSRPNSERFEWEKDPPASSAPMPQPVQAPQPTPAPQPAPVPQPTPGPQPTAVPSQAPAAPAINRDRVERSVLKLSDMAAGYIGGYRWVSEKTLSAEYAPEGSINSGSIIYSDLYLFSSDAEAQAAFQGTDSSPRYVGLDILPAPLTSVHASKMYSGWWKYKGGETAEIRLVQFRVSNVVVQVGCVGKTGVVNSEQAMRLAQTVASRLVAP